MHKSRCLSVSSLALLAGYAAAEGAIVHNTSGISFGPNGTTPWDIDGDSVTDTYATATTNLARLLDSGNDVMFLVSGDGLFPPLRTLSTGVTISAALFTSVYTANNSAFLQFGGSPLGNFSDDESAYVGFSYSLGTPEPTILGWARITPDFDNNTYTVHEWAYEDSGDPIQVGAVPEPAETAMGLGALALGAVGLRRWRKQRKAT